MSRDDYDEFEIDGVGFRLKALSPLVAESLAPAVAGVLAPAMAAMFAGQTDVASLREALKGLKGATEELPKFREAFAARCSVTLAEKAGGELIWTELKGKVFEDTFRRRHKLYFEWLARCIDKEYGDFLGEIGQRLEEAVKASPLSFLLGSLGASGDSPQTPESKTDSPTS
jgi:hypothetical protein